MGVGRAVVVGIGRFEADASGEEVPVGGSAWAELPFVDVVMPRVSAALERLGYATRVHRDVGSAALRAAVAGAIGTARVVYVASHGKASGSNPGRVDVVPADARVGHGTNAAQWVDDAQECGVATLFLFDLCRSGRAAALPHLVHGSHAPANAWVIAASGSGEDAYDGRFSLALAEVLEELARTGLDTDPARSHVPFSTVTRRVRRRVERMPGPVQSVQSTAMVLAEDEPALPFFPNPFHDPAAASVADVDPALRVFLAPGDARHFADKAGTQFTGRRSQLRALAPWLDDVDAGGLRVVVGNPGVGKSALLGALACAAHPELVPVAPHVRARLARDPQGCPSVNDRLAAVHARNRTTTEVFTSIARQLDPATTPDEPLDAAGLTSLLLGAGEVPAVVVDALDEASDPVGLCAELVRLAGTVRADGRPAVRLLVATRPWPQFAALFDLAKAAGGLVDLDDADPDEVRADVADHLAGILATTPGYAPPRMRAIRERLARAVADRLSPPGGQRAQWGAFLVAGIFTRHLARIPAPDSVEAAVRLGSSVPTTLPAVLDLDLAAHPHGRDIRAILAATALARGEGMPLEVALPLAGLFADLDPERARILLPDALFYLRATPDTDGTLLHRLFHQALVDHLTDPSTTPTADDVLDHLLATHTTHDGHVRDWGTAPPYLLRHALKHAEAAGRLDELLADSEYLVHGDPAALVPAFPHAHTDDARTARAVYRTSIGRHRHTDPTTRRRILTLDAARHNAAPLVTAFTDRTHAGTWTAVAATGGHLNPAWRDTLTGHTGWVNAVACTVVDGRPMAVTGSDDRTVRVWDLTSGRPRGRPLTGHTDAVRAVACTVVDGRPVAVTGSDDHTVRVWDLTSGRPRGEPLTGHTDAVIAMACAVVDGRPVAVTGSDDDTVRVWDLTSEQPRGKSLMGPTGWVLAVACTVVDGRPVAVTGAGDCTVRVWDLTSGRPRGEPLTGHTDAVIAVACTVVDGRPVAVTGSRDHSVRVWDLFSEQPRGEPLPGHTGWVNAVACTVVDGRPMAVTGSDDRTVRVWDLIGNRPRGEPLTGHTGSVIAVACAVVEGQPVAVTGSFDLSVPVWDLTSGQPHGEPLTGHTGAVIAVTCTVVDGRPVAVTGSSDCTVRVWDLTSGRPRGEPLTGHTGLVRAVACTVVDGRPVAVTGSRDHSLRVWDLTSEQPRGEPLTGHTHSVNAVACTVVEGRPVAVTGSRDHSLRVWDLTSEQP
ncbi:AAA family ATPase, partial [Embleya sp. NPDC055612]